MPAFSPQEIELLIIVGVALALIMSNRLRPDLVALLVLLALGLSGILPPEQALAGFSRSAVIAIVGLFVITAALERNGVVQWLADHLAPQRRQRAAPDRGVHNGRRAAVAGNE